MAEDENQGHPLTQWNKAGRTLQWGGENYSTVGETAPLKNIQCVTIKLQVLSFNKTSRTECRNLNEHFSLKAVTPLIPTKLSLLETLFGTPLWGKESLKRQFMSHIRKKKSFHRLGCLKTGNPHSKDDTEKMKSVPQLLWRFRKDLWQVLSNSIIAGGTCVLLGQPLSMGGCSFG